MWTKYPSRVERSHAGAPVIGDFFTTRCGMSSGDNKFFVMNAARAAERSLPIDMLYPILPKPPLVPVDEIHADERGWPVLDDPWFLLDCTLPEDEIRERYPTVWAYLEAGVAAGVTSRSVIANRSPWYAHRKHPPVKFLVGQHGRLSARHDPSDRRNTHPFKVLFNCSIAAALCSFIELHPRPFLADMMARQPGLDRQIWDAIYTTRQHELIENACVYAAGLRELRKNSVAAWPIPALTDIKPRRRYWSPR